MFGWIVFSILLVVFFVVVTGGAFFVLANVLQLTLNAATSKATASVAKHVKHVSALNRLRLAYNHTGQWRNSMRRNH